MDDVVICKGADNVDNCIALANMSEELIAQALATGSTSHQPGDIDKGHSGRHNLLGMVHIS